MHLNLIATLVAAVASGVVAAVPSVLPKFKQIKHLDSTSVQCSFGFELTDCQIRVSEHYYRRYDAVLNFQRGRQSPLVELKKSDGEVLTKATYSGGGLSGGHCGVQLEVVHSGVYLVECFGRKESGGWSQGYGLLTSSGRTVLPWNKPNVPLVVTKRGSTESVDLQSPDAWIGCSIRTPAAGPLDLTPGQSVPSGSRYRQYGGSQQNGGCGFQLPDLLERDAGVWDWYAEKQVTAVWQMTLMIIEEAPQGKPTLEVHNPLPLHAGDILEVSCSAPPAAPPAKMTWLLGGEIVRQDELNDTLPGDVGKVRPWQARPVKQTLSRLLNKADEGKVLTCRIEHSALSEFVAVDFKLRNIRAPAVPSVLPKFKQIKHLDSTSVQCSFGFELTDCQIRVSEHYYRRYDAVLNFQRGRQSPSVALKNSDRKTLTTATYSGSGLSGGHCGVQLEVVHSGVYLVECFGRKESGGWSQGYGLLTSSARDVLPWRNPTSSLIAIERGSMKAVDLQSPDEWVGCSIRTPAAGPLDLTPGQSVPSDSRYQQYGGSQENGGCGFQLPDLQGRDGGVWDWYAEKQITAVWLMSLVVIKDAPQGKPSLVVHNSLPLYAGDILQASCVAPPASPPAAITWLLGGKVIRQDELNDTMPIDVAKARPWEAQPVKQTLSRLLTAADDGKVLSCQIEHSALFTIPNVIVTLNIFPNPSVVAETAVVRSGEGHLAELVCIVDARPEAVVQWSRDGTPIVGSPLVIFGRTGTRYWLRLEDVANEDFTNFTCSATNSVGTVSKVIQLTGLPGEPTLADSASGSLLAWNVESYAPLTSTILKIRHGKGLWNEVTDLSAVTRVNRSTVLVTYEYETTAEIGDHSAYLVVANEFGMSNPSHVHRFTPSPSTASLRPSSGITCPALSSRSLDMRCARSGMALSCAKPVPPGTTARLACQPGFQLPEPHPGSLLARCSATGKWSRPLFECTPDCGRRNGVGARPTVAGGRPAAGSEFPWHVALFRQDKKSFQAICGGTLLTPNFVVTAAHCVWSEKEKRSLPPSQHRVAVGKHSRPWEVTDPDEQRFRITKVHVPARYSGNLKKLEADIAVLELASPVQLSLAVNVICVDWEAEFEYQHFTSGSNGTVPGWGVSESAAPSDTLRYVDLPFVPFQECHDSVPADFQPYITQDKICAGFQGRSTSVCAGDSGGGLVFPSQRVGGSRYFLRAVVSSAPVHRSSSQACQAEHRTAFTTISAHTQWLKAVIFGHSDE